MVRRGTRLVCVSKDHAVQIGLPAFVLYNFVELPDKKEPSACDRLLFVGTTQPIKGLSLFIAVCEALRDLPLRKTAYLSDGARRDGVLVASARRAHIDVVFDQSDPVALYSDGFLLFQASDPALCRETFSLVAVEAMARQVPVAGAGTAVLHEVLGDALAFDVPSRDPKIIADRIRSLYADPDRHEVLRNACALRSTVFSEEAFLEGLDDLLMQMDVHDR
jgi:glycosyltransferase involved in cell wall biosynthesis